MFQNVRVFYFIMQIIQKASSLKCGAAGIVNLYIVLIEDNTLNLVLTCFSVKNKNVSRLGSHILLTEVRGVLAHMSTKCSG